MAVMRAVLSLSLFIAFTPSAAAALCLQADHHGSAIQTTHAVDTEPPGESNGAGSMSMVTEPEGTLPAQACCHPRASTPKAVIGAQKVTPPEQATVLPTLTGYSRNSGVFPPPLADPVLEKLDHLAPSLIVLSINRT